MGVEKAVGGGVSSLHGLIHKGNAKLSDIVASFEQFQESCEKSLLSI